MSAWVLAHAVGGRADLPLPFWLFGYGAAAALLVSFAALGLFWPTPRLEDGSRERVLFDTASPLAQALAGLVRGAGMAVFALVMVSAAAGDGSASHVVNYTLVSTLTIAYVQCLAIVVGHVAGVVVAHDRALVLFDKRVATRSQYPLLTAMVLFTVGGLYLLLGG